MIPFLEVEICSHDLTEGLWDVHHFQQSSQDILNRYYTRQLAEAAYHDTDPWVADVNKHWMQMLVLYEKLLLQPKSLIKDNTCLLTPPPFPPVPTPSPVYHDTDLWVTDVNIHEMKMLALCKNSCYSPRALLNTTHAFFPPNPPPPPPCPPPFPHPLTILPWHWSWVTDVNTYEMKMLALYKCCCSP